MSCLSRPQHPTPIKWLHHNKITTPNASASDPNRLACALNVTPSFPFAIIVRVVLAASTDALAAVFSADGLDASIRSNPRNNACVHRSGNELAKAYCSSEGQPWTHLSVSHSRACNFGICIDRRLCLSRYLCSGLLVDRWSGRSRRSRRMLVLL